MTLGLTSTATQSVDPPARMISGRPVRGRHRVVIVGCGFGGLFAARALAGCGRVGRARVQRADGLPRRGEAIRYQ